MSRFIVALLVSFMVFSSLVSAAAVSNAVSSSLSYPLEDMVYSGTITGHDVQLNGTIQEIVAQFQTWHLDIPLNLTFDHNLSALDHLTPFELEKRVKAQLYCLPVAAWNWPWAQQQAILDGYHYLYNLGGGNAMCGTGGKSCARISCSYDSAIYLCNDSVWPVSVGCQYLASYVWDILQQCSKRWSPPYPQWMTGGQEFDTDSWNVVVHGDNC